MSEIQINDLFIRWFNELLRVCYCFFMKYFGFFDKNEWLFWHVFVYFVYQTKICFEEIKAAKVKKIRENKIRKTV